MCLTRLYTSPSGIASDENYIVTIIVKLVQSEWSLSLSYGRGKEWPTKTNARSRGHSIQSLDDALIAPKVALRTSGWAKVKRRRYDGNKEGWGGIEERRDAWKDKEREKCLGER